VPNVALHLIPYAFVASASPLGLAATLTVLRTGRIQALGFAIGVLTGQLVACGVLVLIGTAITAASLQGATDAALVLWYGALATVVVWVPVLAADGLALLVNEV
jgi:hypothetical protein